MSGRIKKIATYKKLLLGFAAMVIFRVAIGLFGQTSLQRSAEQTVLVCRTAEVISELTRFIATFNEADRDARAFLLSGDPKPARDFRDAQSLTAVQLANLRALMKDNSRQQKRLDRFEPLIRQMLREEADAIAHRKESSGTSHSAADGPIVPIQVLQQIRVLLGDIAGEETTLLHQRSIESRKASMVAQTVIAITGILGGGALLICFLLVILHLRRREQAEAKLLAVQEGLEERVAQRTVELIERTTQLTGVADALTAEIADRQKAEEQVRMSEQRYRMLFENSPLPMAVYDAESMAFLAVNRALEDMYGYTSEEFSGMTLPDLRPPEEVPALLEFLKEVANEDSFSGTSVTRHKSGRLITIDVSGRWVDFDGRRARLVLVTDVTEQKHLESQLRQAQKMEAIGRLAGGVAHDFNNLLTIILGYSEGVLRKLPANDPLRSKISEIQAAGQRAASLTQQLLAFSRKQILQPQILDLNAVISNISRMIRRLLSEDIQISLHLDADAGRVQADLAQLEQVLVNLTINARDAMPTGGRLTIETHNSDVDQHAASLQGVAPGQYVVMAVTDSGCGMDSATRAQAFEPFFTTKEVGRGTGLGLSTVLGVVQQSGGTVTLYSEPGMGSTFRIYLPRFEKHDAPIEESRKSKPVRRGEGVTILLVEDEDRVRTLARAVLEEAGYTVLEAANGKAALQIANSLPDAPSLVLSDVVMPEMSGPELGETLERKWPGVPLLYASGYTDHVLISRSVLQENRAFLQKPYTAEALLESVASGVDRGRRPAVLVVEDDVRIRRLLRESLEEANYTVVEADDGQQALTCLRMRQIRLVIADLSMPGKDDLEVMRVLRRNYPDVKVIAISGFSGGGYLKVANQLGAHRMLPKPFQREGILQAVGEVLG